MFIAVAEPLTAGGDAMAAYMKLAVGSKGERRGTDDKTKIYRPRRDDHDIGSK